MTQISRSPNEDIVLTSCFASSSSSIRYKIYSARTKSASQAISPLSLDVTPSFLTSTSTSQNNGFLINGEGALMYNGGTIDSTVR